MPASSQTPTPAGWSLARALGDGWRECAAGLANWRIAHLDGTAILRRRYARSAFGQFWLTLSTGASIAALGAVWTVLWKQPAHEIFPYIAVSMVLWSFISSLVLEGANAFVSQAHALSNQGLAVSTFIYSLLYKAVLVLAHDAVIIVAVLLIFQPPIGLDAWLFVPAFALTLVAGFCVAYLTAMLCARYRDVILLASTVMQLMFYVTPVLWRADFLPTQYAWIIQVNPFTAFLSILRDPLLGHATPATVWWFALATTGALLLVTLLAAGTVRRRLIYWI
jgi:lipopolysaccharide transport system permease protein